nr:rho GTPase activating protein 7 [Hymenolepis microstoma]
MNKKKEKGGCIMSLKFHITLSVPHDNPENEYEFALTEKVPLICPQSVPLPRKAVGPTVISHSNLQSKDISNKTESNFSIDNLSQVSISGFTSRCESETRVTIPASTYSMARLRQRNTSQDVADQSSNAPILATSNHHFHVDHDNLGDTLKNDSIDLGETGRINYRTGSFLGRFTDHSGESTWNRKVEIATNSQQTRSGQTLNDYMVSGQLNESITPAPEHNYNNPSLTRHSPVKRPLPKVPFEPSQTTELDPVLSLLLSDVSQLDELRNNFRDKSVRCSKSVKTPSSSAPHNNQSESTSRSKEREVSAKMKPASPPIIKQEDVDEAQRELTSKIHDLVDLECSSKAKKSEQMKKLSYKDRSTKEPPKDDKGFSFLRVRQHQFRWSERHQRPSPYSALRPPVLEGPEEVKEREIVPALKESTKLVDFTKEKTEPASRIISMLVPHMQDGIPIWVFSAGQLNVLRRMAQTQITLTQEEVCPSNRLIKWRFGRKPSQSKMSASNSPQATPKNSRQELTQPPVSIVLNQQTESSLCDGKPSSLNSTLTNSESENSQIPARTPESASGETEFWPELKERAGSCTDLVASNSYGASRSFTGPVFGRTLAFWQHRVGYPFPPCISNMLSYLQQPEHAAHGIFRRAGGKLRVQALRERIEKNIYWNSFDEWQPYDVADLLKQFFRELPECLLTNKLSTTLINIFHHAPEVCSIDLLRLAMVSLPDENRIALQSLLHFLYALSLRSSLTQMSALNLAICLAPSLFHFSSLMGSSPLLVNFSSRRRKKLDSLGGMDLKDLAEQAAAQKCLCALITYAPNIFVVTESIVLKTRLDSEKVDIPRLPTLLSSADRDPNVWLKQQVEILLRECGSPLAKALSTNNVSGAGTNSGGNLVACAGPSSLNPSSKGSSGKSYWSSLPKETLKTYNTDSGEGENLSGFEIAIGSISPFIRTWRCSLLFPIEDPQIIAEKYWNDRVSWDENVLRAEVMEDLVPEMVQIHRILFNALPPQPARECRLLRGRQLLLKSRHASASAPYTIDSSVNVEDVAVMGVAIVSTSVNHGVVVPEVPQELLPSAHFAKEHLLVERTISHSQPACRVTIISEADIKGFSQEWYSSQWGHYLLRRLLALRHCFAQSPPSSNPNPPSTASTTWILDDIPPSTTKSESEDQVGQHTDEDSSHKETNQLLLDEI